MALSKAEKLAYDEHLNVVMIQNDVISTNRMEAHAEGRAEGRAEQARAIARSLKVAGMDDEFIATHTGLSLTEIAGMD